jgi:hypothetical protein
MSSPEKIETGTAPNIEALGGVAMPENAKQQYVYAVKPSSIEWPANAGQLVIEQLADKSFLEAIPID